VPVQAVVEVLLRLLCVALMLLLLLLLLQSAVIMTHRGGTGWYAKGAWPVVAHAHALVCCWAVVIARRASWKSHSAGGCVVCACVCVCVCVCVCERERER